MVSDTNAANELYLGPTGAAVNGRRAFPYPWREGYGGYSPVHWRRDVSGTYHQDFDGGHQQETRSSGLGNCQSARLMRHDRHRYFILGVSYNLMTASMCKR